MFIRLTVLLSNQMGVFRTTGNILVGDRVAVKCYGGLTEYGLFLQGEFLLPKMGAQVCETKD